MGPWVAAVYVSLSAGRHVISFGRHSPASRTLVTAKDRILKPHIVKYNGIALKRRLVKFLEKRPIFIVGMKTYVQRSITFDWHIRYQSRAVEFCKNILIMLNVSSSVLLVFNRIVQNYKS